MKVFNNIHNQFVDRPKQSETENNNKRSVEHPLHNHDIPDMSMEEVEHVIEAYHRRWLELLKYQQIQFAVLFRNYGSEAGTSLIHPHPQLIAVGIMPRNELLKRRNAHDYYIRHGRCLICDILVHEKDSPRMVIENESFKAFVPFSADVPFETWLFPKEHTKGFGALSDGEKGILVKIFQDVLARIAQAAGEPDYNYILHSQLRSSTEDPWLHWFVQIKPRTTTRAGFKIGSGMRINPSLPEEDARLLRG
jgi:UDPglucose--hexose-1-phosphate uridylyltransferase